MVTTGATALGLLELAPVTADDVVLVMAAAGGVGTLLVQHARRVGATVVGRRGRAREGGAGRRAGRGPGRRLHRARPDRANAGLDHGGPDHAGPDHGESGWTDRVRAAVGEVSLVFDGVGGRLGREAFELIGKGGRQVVFGQAAGEWFHPARTSWRPGRDLLRRHRATCSSRPGGMAELRARALEAVAAGEPDARRPVLPAARRGRRPRGPGEPEHHRQGHPHDIAPFPGTPARSSSRHSALPGTSALPSRRTPHDAASSSTMGMKASRSCSWCTTK